jgi:Bax protein
MMPNRISLFFLLVLITQVIWAQPQLQSHQETFINQILPKIIQVNDRIHKNRQQLQKFYKQYQQKKPLDDAQKQWLSQLAQTYGVSDFNIKTRLDWQLLLQRVDVIPPALVLAQAINESNWGRSRFAEKGNNFFGQWCYQKGCGLVPKRRPPGGHYEVKTFASAKASIIAYMHNLNTNRHYLALRQIRHKLRAKDKPLSAIKLAEGLGHYSSRGSAYIKSLEEIIHHNNLKALINAAQSSP